MHLQRTEYDFDGIHNSNKSYEVFEIVGLYDIIMEYLFKIQRNRTKLMTTCSQII